MGGSEKVLVHKNAIKKLLSPLIVVVFNVGWPYCVYMVILNLFYLIFWKIWLTKEFHYKNALHTPLQGTGNHDLQLSAFAPYLIRCRVREMFKFNSYRFKFTCNWKILRRRSVLGEQIFVMGAPFKKGTSHLTFL